MTQFARKTRQSWCTRKRTRTKATTTTSLWSIMKFTHHAYRHKSGDTEWTFDESKTYNNDPDEHGFKPNGLWLSVDGGWRDWCSGEMPHWLEGPEIEFTVDLSRILVIDTVAKLDAFNETYATPFGTAFYLNSPAENKPYPLFVNWKPLTERYSGIMIAPYFYARRYCGFYYPWDCASACVWDLTAVTYVGLVPPPVACCQNDDEEH